MVDVKRLDILQAQINVSISQARELVSSWLPASPSSTTADSQGSLPISLDNDDDLLKPVPPRLGLGAPIPKHFYDDDQNLRRDISSADLLKRRFLGLKRKATEYPHQHNPRHRSSKKFQAESDSEEEEGRSALGKSKRQKIRDRKSPEGGKERGAKAERKVHSAISGGGTLDWAGSTEEGCITNPELGDDPYVVTKNPVSTGKKRPTKKEGERSNYKIDPTP